MAQRHLTDLADVCRAAGLVVHEVGAWQTRGRSGGSGYEPGRPTHVMVHHTATGPTTDPYRDVDYILGSVIAPIANLYLSRDGSVWVLAGGPTNTNGKGDDKWGGGTPSNDMNRHAIGIEGANSGVGEPWPIVQQRAYVTLCAKLCDHYDIPINNVRAHFEWTSRKIDPAGSSRYADGGNKWDMDKFRGDVFLKLVTTKPPPEPEPGEDMALIAYVAKPPPTMPGNPPWMVVIDGAVRYMTNFDAPANLPAHELNQEQYDYLLKCANLEEGN